MRHLSTDAYETELSLLPIVMDMEMKGVAISNDIHNEYHKWLTIFENAEKIASKYSSAKVGSKAYFNDLLEQKLISSELVQYTEKGNPRYGREFLSSYINDEELVHALEVRSKLQKIIGTYLKPWSESAEKYNGRLYPFFQQTRNDDYGTRTGRFCIAKGTMVQQPGKSTSIEDVEVGSMVYSYDDDCKLCIRKVVSKAMTGYRELVRVHWQVNGSGAKGYLECTPDHRIRLVSGEYVEAGKLSRNDRVLAVRRDTSGAYNRLNSTRQFGTLKGGKKECLILAELTLGRELYEDECVHHIDHDKKNDVVNNLLVMKKQHHAKYHSLQLTKINGAELLEDYDPNSDFLINEYGEIVNVSNQDLVNALEASCGVASRAAYLLELKPFIFRDLCRERGIDLNVYRSMFTKNGKKITCDLVKEARELNIKYGIESACSYLGMGWQRWEKIQREFGFEPVPPKGNHIITEIEFLSYKSDVYDLEIEDTHNFIANEICVHNSSDLQQVPRAPKDDMPNLRNFIVADEGYVLVGRDFNSQEVRVAAHFAEGAILEAYKQNPRLDSHTFVQNIIREKLGVELERHVVKTISFLKLYGGGPKAAAAQLDISEFEASQFFAAYDKALPEFKELAKDVERHVKSNGWLRTWGGRLYGVEQSKIVNGRRREFYYKLLNVLVQGSSADMTKHAMIRYHYHKDRHPDSRIMLTIHDEIVLHCPEHVAEEEMERLRWAMDEIHGWDVPLLSDGAIGKTLADLK